MLNKIIEFALHNRLFILLTAVLLTFGGIYVTETMEVDVFPDLNAPTVVIMTEAQGMAPEEVEKTVTFPIETAVNGATDVRRVRSSSTTGFSVVWVEFDWGTDIYRDRQIVSEKLATLGDQLPANVGTPTLGPQSCCSPWAESPRWPCSAATSRNTRYCSTWTACAATESRPTRCSQPLRT